MTEFDPTGLRDAATVVLVRDGARGVEVLLLRRHAKSGFFGDAFAFAGGSLDEEDQGEDYWRGVDAEVVERCARLQPTPGRQLSRPEALGLWVAALRELFEEAGVLLAQPVAGEPWQPPDAVALAAARHAVHAGERTFAAVLGELGAGLCPARLGYWGHWITPSVEGKRYDTRFFIAAHPAGQVVRRDEVETTEQVWLAPREILARNDRGELLVPPPTLHVIDELDRLLGDSGVARLPALVAARRVVPLMPRVGAPDGDPAVLLPWDPAFDAAQGQRLPGNVDYGREWRSSPSRIVLRDGVWRLWRPDEA